MPAIYIRQAKNHDFSSVFRLLEQLWDYKKLNRKLVRVSYLRSLKEPNARSFIAVKDKMAIGFASTLMLNRIWQAGMMMHLNELVVDENIRGRGVGKALMRHVEAYARKKHCRGVELETAKRRRKTHRFYKKLGYNPGALFFVKLFYKDR